MKFYFDITCPYSFTGYQILKSKNVTDIHFKPIVRRKFLTKRGRKNTIPIPQDELHLLQKFRERHHLNPVALKPTDYNVPDFSHRSSLFLTLISRRHPALLPSAVDLAFRRYWIENQDTNHAFSLMKMCRLVGLDLAESDNLVAQVESRENVLAANACVEEAVDLEKDSTPIVEIDGEEQPEIVKKLDHFDLAELVKKLIP
ncbi:hypothetical protein L596_000381 [Steinernema carpocapsae]|uniref:DSBA-like thioredoxin domain-containing protein n=1 Tax=Steinernema carpocapsae TaxID=34508 RepID=A0A4U8UK82_STECR|nr:hypothetical protein L596_000381 [Steinernema carpocapsae]